MSASKIMPLCTFFPRSLQFVFLKRRPHSRRCLSRQRDVLVRRMAEIVLIAEAEAALLLARRSILQIIWMSQALCSIPAAHPLPVPAAFRRPTKMLYVFMLSIFLWPCSFLCVVAVTSSATPTELHPGSTFRRDLADLIVIVVLVVLLLLVTPSATFHVPVFTRCTSRICRSRTEVKHGRRKTVLSVLMKPRFGGQCMNTISPVCLERHWKGHWVVVWGRVSVGALFFRLPLLIRHGALDKCSDGRRRQFCACLHGFFHAHAFAGVGVLLLFCCRSPRRECPLVQVLCLLPALQQVEAVIIFAQRVCDGGLDSALVLTRLRIVINTLPSRRGVVVLVIIIIILAPVLVFDFCI
mmetsp:Transcript_1781/g.4144  ORF Transcript_1781/g.4144 Transcript_1781/m.4144 type:complete len:353 (+) Transcript_1781:1910-2968(+)